MIIAVMTDAPASLFVAPLKISMKGTPVLVFNAAPASPRQKSSAIYTLLESSIVIPGTWQLTKRANPMIPLSMMEDIMTQGTTVDAFLISSAVDVVSVT